MIITFLWKGADGEDGLPGEMGKAGPPVCRVLNIQYLVLSPSLLNSNSLMLCVMHNRGAVDWEGLLAFQDQLGREWVIHICKQNSSEFEFESLSALLNPFFFFPHTF